MEGGGPMKGKDFGIFNSFNSYFIAHRSYSQQGLKKYTHQQDGCFLRKSELD